MDNVLRVFVSAKHDMGKFVMMREALWQLTKIVLFTDIISMTPLYDENGLTLIVIHK